MRWYLSTTNTEVSKVEEALAVEKTNLGDLDSDTEEHVEAAVATALQYVQAGYVGTDIVDVVLDGNANPGHKPIDGIGNDELRIVVASAEHLA